MKPIPHSLKQQRGAAAVELAFILPILVLLIFVPLTLGRLFWAYTVTQKAAQDTARYMSTISAQEMRDQPLATAAANVGRTIVNEELADLRWGSSTRAVEILCNNVSCSSGVGSRPLPSTVKVVVQVDFLDPTGFFNLGRYGIPLQAVAEMRYVGN
ncbi:Flp pilus assembly protein TadG [Massilia sp. UYP11]|uniref:TadE/TadG family type IV pilus assembly protein n=1 Tax=Massilia sp. UYP11 TaxID=1756385 RepID=UPI003D25E077